MAHTYGVDVIPHSWGTGIAIRAAIHLVANLDPNPGRMRNPLPLLELDRTENDLRDVLTGPLLQINPQNGVLKMDWEKPGLGVNVDTVALEKYRIE